jgi:hypothetical protein
MSHERPALRKTKQLILHWVNLPDSLSDSWPELMLRGHPEVFGPFAHNQTMLREVIEKVRAILQLAWKAPDMRVREWRLFIARQVFSEKLLGGLPVGYMKRLIESAGGESIRPHLNVSKLLLIAPPPETAFDQVRTYAQQMACCEMECKEPFFLRGPKRERYCPECKGDARRRRRKRYYDSKEKFNRKPAKSAAI